MKFRARTGIPWPHEKAFGTISDDIKKSLAEIKTIILELSDEKTKYVTTKRDNDRWFFRELGVENRYIDVRLSQIN